jgi:predicted ATPase
MITNLHISNFRSLSKVDMDLSKFTLLTGANNSGKSSFIYALLSLKNIVTNPNQSPDNFFTFPFINLGGFAQTILKKKESATIELGITFTDDNITNGPITFLASIGKQESFFRLHTVSFSEIKLPVSFPYSGSTVITVMVNYSDGGESTVNWYGINGTVSVSKASTMANDALPLLQRELIAHLNAMASIDGVSIRRGFTKPFFGAVPLQTQFWTEDEIATLLSTDRDLEGKVAHYLERIVDRTFSVRVTPGTSNFYLQTRDRETAFVADLVNEGLGTNQLVSLLAKILYKNTRLVCIDEPEIHLHPTIINRLVDTLIDIADVEDKQFVVSTHSEHFVNALLRNVVSQRLQPDDLKAYYLTKNRKGETQIEAQPVNEKGQLKGGLKNFYEAELENMKDLFNLTE